MPLERFGFTPTESRVYAELVRSGATTGYAIARSLGIARANVYQALEALVRRGAAHRISSTPARYSPVEAGTLLRNLEVAVRRDLDQLQDELSKITPSPEAGAARAVATSLRSASEVVRLAVEVAESERTQLLVITGPWVPQINAALERARRRQVELLALALGEPAPIGSVLREAEREVLVRTWGGLPVLVAASAAAVMGVLGDGGSASGAAVHEPGALAFLAHLVRRELASGGDLTT